jgi:uncharacterized protein YbbC (DUF1343 family)
MIYDEEIKSQFPLGISGWSGADDSLMNAYHRKDAKDAKNIVEPVRTGLECLIAAPPKWLFGKRIGLLCNPASVDRRFRHARTLIHQTFPGQLTALFSPQHGFYAEKQDNMIESGDGRDPLLQIPLYSLYGRTRIPTPEMFESIDVLIVDLQDAGTRVYTFIYTLSYCMEAARDMGKTIVVLDRPNPVNGRDIEGNCLSPECRSFVGRFPIPMRHGLTIGEMAGFFNRSGGIGCHLEVISMSGWKRWMHFADTGLPWVAPSPNLPTPASAAVYPGQVIWEGTNISEGRGTTQPFELFGAPFIDPARILSSLTDKDMKGIVLRETAFEPTSGKWQGKRCRGFQIHITEPEHYRPYLTTLKLLQAVIRHHPNDFSWKSPPYEYEFEKLPIDLIIGEPAIRKRLENMDSLDVIAESWMPDMNRFSTESRQYHLYSGG